MPILRSLHRGQLWKSQGYVCNSCRHKLGVAQIQWPRWQSSTASQERGVDDWLSNFNNLSVKDAPKSRVSPIKAVSNGKGRASGEDGDVKGGNEKQDGGSSPRGGEKGETGSFDRLKSALRANVEPSGGAAAVTTSLLDRDNPPTSRTPRKRKKHRSPSVLPRNLRRSRERGLMRAQRILKERAEKALRKKEQQRIDGPQHPPATGVASTEVAQSDQRTAFQRALDAAAKDIDDLLRAHRTSSPHAAKTSDALSTSNPASIVAEQASAPREHAAKSALKRPQFSASASPDSRQSSADLLNLMSEKKAANEPELAAPVRRPSFISTPASMLTHTSRFAASQASAPLSPAQQVEETRSRPKWGGMTAPSRDEDGNTSFLDQLRPSSSSETEAAASASALLNGDSTNLAAWGVGPASASEDVNSLRAFDTTRAPAKSHVRKVIPRLAETHAVTTFADSPGELAEESRIPTRNSSPPDGKQHNVFSTPPSKNDMACLKDSLSGELVSKSRSATDEVHLLKPPKLEEVTEAPFVPSGETIRRGTSTQTPNIVREVISNRHNHIYHRLERLKHSKSSEAHQQPTNEPARSTTIGDVDEVDESDASSRLGRLHVRSATVSQNARGPEGDESDMVADPTQSLSNTSSVVAAETEDALEKGQASSHDEGLAANTTIGDRGPFMLAATQNDHLGGDGGSAGVPGGSDDGEHKSLWEVMSNAEALKGNVADSAEQAQISEQTVATDDSDPAPLDLSTSEPADVLTISPSKLIVNPLNIQQPSVPGLEYGLDRVLFNPGVYQLQDPLSRVYNFDPYLQKIMPVMEFDFTALKEYKTSSQDTMLANLAREHDKRYIGSTSSMTGTLGHFHYLLSDWRPVNLNMLSRGFTDRLDTFTQLNRAPNAIFLRWKNGTYAIDADKAYDSGNVLMLLGKSMEKLLTMPTPEYERYRKSDPRTVSKEERTSPEAFEYTTMGDFLMRSQLDAYDSRLPGTGMFDLKTRAVLSVRMNADDFQPMTGYELYTLQGRFGSYEREYYDMMRSTMLKYMLQARIGRMDGIFIAYHNVERIFGFQYASVQEMDRALHGQVDPCLGNQEFKASLNLMNKVLDKATAKFPEQSMRLHFETTTESLGSGNPTTVMWIFAEPMSEPEIERIQATSKEKVAEFERSMMGVEKAAEPTAPVRTTVDGEDSDESMKTAEGASALKAADVSKAESPSEDSDTQSSASAEFATSQSSADSPFLNAIPTSNSIERRPLFAASIICKSRVNGTSVLRPEPLKPSDTWEVEYLLREWNDPEAMWARYVQMKQRRKDLFEKFRNDDDEGGNNGEEGGELTSKQKRDKAFTDLLKSMSQSGREFRNKMDQLEAGRDPVVVGQPVHRTHLVSDTEQEVSSVEQYMGWLYGR